jgi:hypothetical protein
MAMQAYPLGEGKERLRCWSVECSLWVLGLRALVIVGLFGLHSCSIEYSLWVSS